MSSKCLYTQTIPQSSGRMGRSGIANKHSHSVFDTDQLTDTVNSKVASLRLKTGINWQTNVQVAQPMEKLNSSMRSCGLLANKFYSHHGCVFWVVVKGFSHKLVISRGLLGNKARYMATRVTENMVKLESHHPRGRNVTRFEFNHIFSHPNGYPSSVWV